MEKQPTETQNLTPMGQERQRQWEALMSLSRRDESIELIRDNFNSRYYSKHDFGGHGDDVTMDCDKCKVHIRSETLKEVGDKVGAILLYNSTLGHKLKLITDLVADYLKQGEMP